MDSLDTLYLKNISLAGHDENVSSLYHISKSSPEAGNQASVAPTPCVGSLESPMIPSRVHMCYLASVQH